MANLKKGSVRQLSAELEDFNEIIKKLHKELGKLEKGTKEYTDKQEELNKVIKDGIDVSKKLFKEKGKLNSSNKNHKKSINDANEAQRKFNDAIRQSSLNVGKNAKAQNNWGKRIKSATSTLLSFGAAYRIINGLTRLFTELTVGSAKQAIEFQKSLGNLSAVAGVSGEELEMLSKNAELVAGQTKFTAEEIVGLQTELSKLGFTSTEVVESTQGIAFAAQALASPLGATAEAVGKIINQFDLLTSESGLVADVLVTTINESALSFESFGTAIQYVGPIAKQLNLKLEQTAGAMATLADNGFTAYRIGTGLRGILTEIGKTSVDAEAELQRLAEANISLSEAVELVGKRNAAQLITLLNNIEVIDDSSDKYYQQGRAAEAAAKQSETFAGQVELLTSAWNAFRRDLGKFVAESDIVIRAIGLLSSSAEKTARGFEVVSEFKGGELAEDLNKAADSGDATSVALERMSEVLGISEERLRKMVETSEEMENMDVTGGLFGAAGPDFIFGRDNIRRTQGYIQLLKESTEQTILQNAANDGRAKANEDYGDSVQRLIDLSNHNLNVNKDIDSLHQEIENHIGERDEALGKLSETEKVQRKEIEAEIKALKQLQQTLVNITTEEDKTADKRKKETEDIKDRYSALRDTVFNQKSAREFNEIIDKAYAGMPERINKVRQELAGLTEGTAEYAKKEGELDYLEGLAKTIKNFKLNEKDIENIVKKLYDHILIAADREKLEKFTKEFSKDINKAIEDTAEGLNLVPTVAPPEKTQEALSALQRFQLEALKSFQTLVYELENEGASLAQNFYEGIVETRFENLQSELDAEIDLIRNRYDIEQDILQASLNNQLITESQFRTKQEELRKSQIAKENDVEKKRFDAKKKQDLNIANSEFLAAIAQSLINEIRNGVAFPQALINAAIMSGGAAIAYAGQRSAINGRKFFAKKFEEGGMVSGPSHAEGGVPFTVQGQGGYEMEGGEFIINKRATAMHRDLLERINNSQRVKPMTGSYKFAQGGFVAAQTNESVDYLKAIAEATTSSAIQASKPVRAFVSSKDLRSNETERRLRDRNDRI